MTTRRSIAAIGRGALRRARAASAALAGRTAAPAGDTDAAPGDAGGPDASGWWDLLPFTSHRIELAPGIDTANDGTEARHDVRTQLVLDACGGSLEGRTVVDLGCLEGGFTLAFAAHGAARALGIEARDVSVRRAELARDLLGLANAEFVRADIKDELARHEPFDVVFASGILYHLSDPAAFLRTMRSACTAVAVIDTHVARADVVTHRCSEVVERVSGGVAYRGRMFPEYAPTTSDREKESLLWAAYSDTDAFWPLEDELVRMISAAGFGSIEKIDPLAGDRLWSVDHVNRVVYVARP